MIRSTLKQAFHKSVDALARGESLEQVLHRYPQHADELRGLLSIAERAMKQSADQPSRAAQHRSRTAMLSRAKELRPSAQAKSLFPPLRWGLALALVAIFLFTAGGVGLVAASAQALPGDDLYPVKRQAERIQLSFTGGGQNRLNLTITQDTRRVAEVRRLLSLGRSVEVQFEAALESTSGALWQFAGIPVLVTGETVVPSGLRVGDVIQVSARTTSQGWVRAHRFSAAGLTFDGRIEAMKSNQWIIDGRAVTIIHSSNIDPELQLGDLVRARTHTEGEFLVAQHIRAIEPEATPVPTLIPSNIEPSVGQTPSDEEDGDFDDEFHGIVEAIDGDVWTIGGRTFTVTSETEIEGHIQIGDRVEVELDTDSSGNVFVEEIELVDDDDFEDDFDDEFHGIVEAIDGNSWTIGGRVFTVTSETEIEGHIQIGDWVEVELDTDSSGNVFVEEIELVDDDDLNEDYDDDFDDEHNEDDEDDDDDEDPTASLTQVEDDEDEDDHDEDLSGDSTEIEFEGIVEAIESGQWVVDGKTLLITSETRIEGDLSVGDEVRVDALESSDGTLYAERIRLED